MARLVSVLARALGWLDTLQLQTQSTLLTFAALGAPGELSGLRLEGPGTDWPTHRQVCHGHPIKAIPNWI